MCECVIQLHTIPCNNGTHTCIDKQLKARYGKVRSEVENLADNNKMNRLGQDANACFWLML